MRFLPLALLPLLVSGCTYDYAQRMDRVSYSAGNAVRANLEAQTVNPAKKSMYSTAGLGKNGPILPIVAAAPVQ